MDVRFTDEQNLLRDSARAFLDRRCSIEEVRGMIDDERGYADTLWREAVELGWAGLACPNDHGGAGLGVIELCVLMEETGRALMPGPLFSTAVVGAAALSLGGSASQRDRWLPAIADGRAILTLAQLESSAHWGPQGIELRARSEGEGHVLNGSKLFVPDAAAATAFIVVARARPGLTLFLIDASAPGVAIEPTAYTDLTRRMAAVSFDDVSVGADAVLGEPGRGWSLLEAVHDRAKVALAAAMCGGMSRALEISVEYAKTREQFGSPIGRFQSIQHKCADMFVLLESGRSATYYAAWAIDNDEPDAHRSACLAKAYCSDGFDRVAREAIQIHGGFGFTWESDCHLFYKRAKADGLAFGDAAWNRELAARELLDGR